MVDDVRHVPPAAFYLLLPHRTPQSSQVGIRALHATLQHGRPRSTERLTEIPRWTQEVQYRDAAPMTVFVYLLNLELPSLFFEGEEY
jgi:hypothetical protein